MSNKVPFSYGMPSSYVPVRPPDLVGGGFNPPPLDLLNGYLTQQYPPSFAQANSFFQGPPPIQEQQPDQEFTLLAQLSALPPQMQSLVLSQNLALLADTSRIIQGILRRGASVQQLVLLGLAEEVVFACAGTFNAPSQTNVPNQQRADPPPSSSIPVNGNSYTQVSIPGPGSELNGRADSDIEEGELVEDELPQQSKWDIALRGSQASLGSVEMKPSFTDEYDHPDDMDLEDIETNTVVMNSGLNGGWKDSISHPSGAQKRSETPNVSNVPSRESSVQSMPGLPHYGRSRRPHRPLAADLNSDFPGIPHHTKFVSERRISYIIDLSDSDTEDVQRTRADPSNSSEPDYEGRRLMGKASSLKTRSNGRDVTPPATGSVSKNQASVRLQMLQIEIEKKRLEMKIAEMKKKGKGNSSTQAKVPAAPQSSVGNGSSTALSEIVPENGNISVNGTTSPAPSASITKQKVTDTRKPPPRSKSVVPAPMGATELLSRQTERANLAAELQSDEIKLKSLRLEAGAIQSAKSDSEKMIEKRRQEVEDAELRVKELEEQLIVSRLAVQSCIMQLKDAEKRKVEEEGRFLDFQERLKSTEVGVDLKRKRFEECEQSLAAQLDEFNKLKRLKSEKQQRPETGDFIMLPGAEDQPVSPNPPTAEEKVTNPIDGVEWTDSECGFEELLTVGNIILPMNYVALPSDISAISERMSKETLDGKPSRLRSSAFVRSERSAGNEPSFKPYQSILQGTKLYRNRATFLNEVKSGFKSLTYFNRADPNKRFCPYETSGGTCNDTTCQNQHFRDLGMNDEDVLRDLSSSANLETSSSDHQSRPITLQPADGVKQASPVPPLQLNPRNPIFLSGLQKLADGETPTSGRYYHVSLSEASYVELLTAQPHNIPQWLNYAALLLPPGLTAETLDRPSGNLNRALKVLAQALQHNRNSEEIWNFYLEVYVRRGRPDDIREVFEQAVGFAKGWSCWWRYACWERGERADSVLKRIVLKALNEAGIEPEERSRTVLNAHIQRVRLRIEQNRCDLAVALSRNFIMATHQDGLAPSDGFLLPADDAPNSITNANPSLPPLSETAASVILTPSDLAIVWVLHVHMIYYERLPAALFESHPHDYMLRRVNFAVKPNENTASERVQTAVEFLEHALGGDFFDYHSGGYSCLAWSWHFATYDGGGGDRAEDIKRSLRMCRNPGLSILALTIESNSLENLWSENDNKSSAPFAWSNLFVKVLSRTAHRIDPIVQALVNAIHTFFKLPEIPNDRWATGEEIANALALYRVALELHLDEQESVPGTTRGPVPTNDQRTYIRSNPFLWLNAMNLAYAAESLSDPDVTMDGATSGAILELLFDESLKSFKGHDERKLLWTEYIKIQRARQGGESIITSNRASKEVLAMWMRAIQDTKLTHTHPFDSASVDIDFVKWVPLKDLSTISSYLQAVLEHLTEDQYGDTLDSLLRILPDVGCLPAVSRHYLQCGKWREGKQCLMQWLKSRERDPFAWKVVAQVVGLSLPQGAPSWIADLKTRAEDLGPLYLGALMDVSVPTTN
ncbi:hypothetical protein BJ742DRAFT_881110 [Cladochytrium replicatum]|nr:hypothetical protein BJ742DRAFT_881110 [Cladochytrium replicatum]